MKKLTRRLIPFFLMMLVINYETAAQAVKPNSRPAGKVVAAKSNRHNPVFNIDFPDPTVINVNGTYYAYATQGSYNGKMSNIQTASSKDLYNWKYEGDALPQKPVWANHTQDFWAPHVFYDSLISQYVMFFCAKSNDTASDKCIGVAFADKPTGPFVDKGTPLIVGKGFSEIDPMVFIDPATGKKLLYWGSGFMPLRVRELTDDWKAFKEGSVPKPLIFPGSEKNYTALIEGAWVDYYGGKYYLYYSGDNCCGSKANYAVMVAKADSAAGPFKRLGEVNGTGSSVILEKDSQWIAPGHNSIVKDKKGNRWIAYHAITKDTFEAGKLSGADNVSRVFCIKPIVYKNGWPLVLAR